MCEESGIWACRIPTYLVVAGQISSLRREIAELEKAVTKEKIMSCVGSSRSQLTSTDIVLAYLENISVTGTHPIFELTLQLSDTIIKKVSELSHSRSSPATPEPPEFTTEAPTVPWFSKWVIEGRLHLVSQGWKLPRPL